MDGAERERRPDNLESSGQDSASPQPHRISAPDYDALFENYHGRQPTEDGFANPVGKERLRANLNQRISEADHAYRAVRLNRCPFSGHPMIGVAVSFSGGQHGRHQTRKGTIVTAHAI